MTAPTKATARRCAWCGRYRSEEDRARAEAGALVSHGLCDRCEADLVDEGIDAAREEALR